MRKLMLLLSLLIGSCGVFAQSKVVKRDDQSITNQTGNGSVGNVSTPQEPKRDLRGYDAVDLGLPSGLLWASCNVGATAPADAGDYFGWGEIRTKDEYHSANSMTWDRQMADISRNPKYDAARANRGGSWRLPTQAEMEELLNCCSWTWMDDGGVTGYSVTGPNGSSIFLPAAGYRYGSSLLYEGADGDYWTSTPHDEIPIFACRLVFALEGHKADWTGREFAFPIRPVSD